TKPTSELPANTVVGYLRLLLTHWPRFSDPIDEDRGENSIWTFNSSTKEIRQVVVAGIEPSAATKQVPRKQLIDSLSYMLDFIAPGNVRYFYGPNAGKPLTLQEIDEMAWAVEEPILQDQVRLGKPYIEKVRTVEQLFEELDVPMTENNLRIILNHVRVNPEEIITSEALVGLMYEVEGTQPVSRQGIGGVGLLLALLAGKIMSQTEAVKVVDSMPLTERSKDLGRMLVTDPLSNGVRNNREAAETSLLEPIVEDPEYKTHVVVDLSFLAKITTHPTKADFSNVISRSEEFKHVRDQIRAAAGDNVVFDIITPYSSDDTTKILELTEVDLKPGQFNLMFPEMGIDEIVGEIKNIYKEEKKKDVLSKDEDEEIEKRIVFLLTEPWAKHYEVEKYKDKPYSILIGPETATLSQMVYGGLMLVNAILTGTPEQFVAMLEKWYADMGIPMPPDMVPAKDENGQYNVMPDTSTGPKLERFLNNAAYAQEVNVHA
ncbi:hypothetical protein ACFLQ8_03305, partial [Candidatus Auribacterota bacterium]